MLIVLDNYLSDFTEGISEHEVPGVIVRDGIGHLFNKFPRLEVELTDINAKSFRQVGLTIDGEYATTEDAYAIEVENSTLTLGLIPNGEGEFGQIIVGVVLVVVGVVIGYFAGWTGFGAVIAEQLIVLGVGQIIGGIVTMVFFSQDLPMSDMTQSLLNNSATYTFDGMKNTTASGTAIQIVYGTHRVGGHVLSMYTRSD